MTWRSLNDVLHEATEDDLIALDRYKGLPAMDAARLKGHGTLKRMRERFVIGLGEELSAEERRRYRREWAPR